MRINLQWWRPSPAVHLTAVGKVWDSSPAALEGRRAMSGCGTASVGWGLSVGASLEAAGAGPSVPAASALPGVL